MRINPVAICLWIFAASIGGAIAGTTGALWGLAAGTGCSLFMDLVLPRLRR